MVNVGAKVTIVFTLVAVRGAMPQTASPAPTFEVSSIRKAPPESGWRKSNWAVSPGRLSYSNVTLGGAILKAFGIQTYQLSAPPGLFSDQWNIVATMPANTSQEQVLQMLQALLADRFKLAFHRQTKQIDVYALLVAERSKLRASQTPGPGSFGVSRTSSGTLRIHGTGTLSILAYTLSHVLDRIVLDMTGLEETVGVTIEWTPSGVERASQSPSVPAANRVDDVGIPAATTPGPSIFQAFERSLGLKLEPRKKVPVEYLVIDHVERVPTDN
jgi:uncharacterized protein (TIGR03435 family)